MRRPDFDFSGLTPQERLDLVEEIWDGLLTQPENVPLTGAQRAELNSHLNAMERDGGEGIPWEEVLQQVRRRTE